MSKSKGLHLCGFCVTGDHRLCPEVIRNGENAASGPVWNCPCAATGHTLGKQPPVVRKVLRLDPAVLNRIRETRARTAGSPPGRPAVQSPGHVQGEWVDHCVKCGWDFGHMQERKTCGSVKACERRQAAGDPTLGKRKNAA